MRSCYFTKSETTVLKGVVAIVILVHHLYQETLIGEEYAVVDYVFRSLGYIGVACFFFFSGYGLTISNIRSQGEYFNTFIKSRLLPLYMVNVFLIWFYSGTSLLFTASIDFGKVAQSFLFGNSIVPAGWYLQELLLFYLIYWMSWKISPNKFALIVMVIISIFPFILLFLLDPHWYISSMAFCAGIIYVKNKSIIDNKLANKVFFCYLFVFLSLTTLSAYVSIYILNLRFLISMPLKLYVIAPFIPLALIVFSSRFEYRSRVFAFLGRYALELYVLQGFVFLLLRNNYWNCSNVLFIVLSIPCLILISIIFHPVFNYIMNIKWK